eukprot:Blabericola_migrator_1__5122@NODE_2649_length_2492_cov_83_183918_g1552_i4_p1_GENE_NODE_2649_length_2492_cov_83_183918_g1552_i4NODE_2649_length_2492_cov_83_183918_g1552_i4_p1_ORF_typecomplete_len456_score49_34Asp_protease_2/PF13650_6/1_2e06gagasp_proteas/PF13975_6/2_5e05Asp_protease/PF09668_10/5_8e03Asp_protease/PF09668_10/6_3e05zfCCHC_3/PF13917_6/0_017zfCCHC_3/PF13917_6/0_036zfCCHC_5/PF14787_6/3_2e03zfCCHC_5/PF14787_6/1zfCCHC_5/PF14787_6/0_0085zfCCHC/PF00098_23/0_00047zfCCHC/PF00098_23/8_4RVP/PF
MNESTTSDLSQGKLWNRVPAQPEETQVFEQRVSTLSAISGSLIGTEYIREHLAQEQALKIHGGCSGNFVEAFKIDGRAKFGIAGTTDWNVDVKAKLFQGRKCYTSPNEAHTELVRRVKGYSYMSIRRGRDPGLTEQDLVMRTMKLTWGVGTSYNSLMNSLQQAELLIEEKASAWLVQPALSVCTVIQPEVIPPDRTSSRPKVFCSKCGKRGHFGRDCTLVNKDTICEKCDKRGHLAEACRQYTFNDVNGKQLLEVTMNKNGMGLRISTTNQEGKMATWESGLKEILEMLQRKRAGVEKGLATKAANRGTERSDFTTGMHDGKASETTEKEQDRIYRIMTEELNASDERHLILNANINGMNAEVILDEGAQACCMSLQEARRLKIGITSGRRSLKGLGDHTTHAWLSEPTSFQLGTKKIQLLFHILSTPSPTLISIGAQRSLGIDKLLSQNKLKYV